MPAACSVHVYRCSCRIAKYNRMCEGYSFRSAVALTVEGPTSTTGEGISVPQQLHACQTFHTWLSCMAHRQGGAGVQQTEAPRRSEQASSHTWVIFSGHTWNVQAAICYSEKCNAGTT